MMAILPVMAMAMVISATDPNAMKLRVQDAHVQAAVTGESVGVSMLLHNAASTTLVITGAYTPVAGDTILQKYAKDANGMVQVVPIDALKLVPDSDTVLAPGAVELQLINLTQDLKAGLEMPLTLKFNDGTTRVIRLKVDGD